VDEDLGRLLVTPQIPLGERGTLVRAVGFFADEHDPAAESFLAQRFRRLGARQAGPDDHDGLVVAHLRRLLVRGWSR
jgi:hypothetical protein